MDRTPPTWGEISPERPLIILQTNNRFGDSDEDFGDRNDPLAEATRHGREAVRAFREAVPDELKPFCQLQLEVRVRDHQARYDRFRRVFDELQAAHVPANLQFADPHDMYVFDPEYVDRLAREYPCIQSYTITEINFEHYRAFNVPRYALSPEARYAMDIIDLAAARGKHLSISLQGLKWMHIGADVLNQPLLDKIAAHPEYVLAVNEHIGPQHLPRQTSVLGMWIAGCVNHWGVEPQSWWFENGRMIAPGVFGQFQPDNTRIMPPPLYRAMILQGALLGATVYQFEPFWDLFDYDNARCWRDVIAPTLAEVIRERLIPTRDQVVERMQVAYQYKLARDINEFHENLRDVDFTHDEGFLARAAYGVWERFLEHELIPNKRRYFFIPLLPPRAPRAVLARFAHVTQPGECDSEAEYTTL
ncbi:MAG TPA: glycoside hydrolase family 98 domain-containing protein, partial [Candidatus Hydrogenedentes bacterium]|nr:glycoside hydrolase family 98 domain-containing protein [Candidatus Hydrogenedentota bacterium]